MLLMPPIPVLFLLVLAPLAQVHVCPMCFLLPAVIVGLLRSGRMVIVVIGIVINSTISAAQARDDHHH